MFKLKIVVISFSVFLVGCGSSEPDRDVEYYLDHNSEREAKVKACKNSARVRENSKFNCSNASNAHYEVQKYIMLYGEEGLNKLKSDRTKSTEELEADFDRESERLRAKLKEGAPRSKRKTKE